LEDVLVVGASIAGLNAAQEIAKNGVDVKVLEEHREIGLPEKCDGLVSVSGISELGLVPPANAVQNSFSKAVFFSPSMKEITIDARKQNVIVLDRSRFDKFLAETAIREGADLELGKRVSGYYQSRESVKVKTEAETLESKLLLDCSGYETYIKNGGYTLQGGQYVVYGKWFDKSTVEVYLDPKSAPSFFKWVIPISSDTAKIGVAGTTINTFSVLDSFVKEKGGVAIRKSAAPVICAGTIEAFVDRRVAKAGDAAGQAKPTTGGGIYTGGYGGLLAGKAASHSITDSEIQHLSEYEKDWRSRFDKEFRTQLRARNVFAKLSASQIDQLFEIVASSDIPRKISEEGDFDRHSIAIIGALGTSKAMSVFGMVLANEIRSFLS
jgi:digeranylgeranylglycerophospholipid reductase